MEAREGIGATAAVEAALTTAMGTVTVVHEHVAGLTMLPILMSMMVC